MSNSDISALGDQAFELFDRGDLNGAKALYEKIYALDSQDAESQMMLGVIKAETGDVAGAVSLLRQVVVLAPEYADAFYYLGSVLQARGQGVEAVTCLQRAVELDPEFTEAHTLLNKLQNQYGTAQHDQSSNNQTLLPESQQAFNRASTLLQQEKLEEAAACYEEILINQPELASVWFMLGRTRGQQGQYAEAERCCLEASRFDPGLVEAHLMLASLLLMQGKIEDACSHSDKALSLDPDNINSIALAANIAKHMGEPEKAYSLLAPLLEKGVEQINIALAFAMISKDVGRQQEAIDLMEKILSSNDSLSLPGKSNLHFNLGELNDSIKQYDKAFYHYQQGNDLKSVSFDRQQHARSVDRHITVHSPDFMATQPRAQVFSGRPIFVVGMVRSGTSLVEQILSSHADVYGAGELGDIYQISQALPGIIGASDPYPECLSQITQEHVDGLSQRYLDHLSQISPDSRHVVDKLPGNFMHLGLIESLFPGARVIHCMRDPIDTCLSTYFQDFSTSHAYAYDLTNLGAYYQGYLKLMAHWRKVLTIPMLELKYEDLIADQESVSRSLVEFCGLEWDDRCLQFHETKRFIRTASYDQVNRPLYKKSVARWKNYESHLGALLDALKG